MSDTAYKNTDVVRFESVVHCHKHQTQYKYLQNKKYKKQKRSNLPENVTRKDINPVKYKDMANKP